jgi:hypothetical protein
MVAKKQSTKTAQLYAYSFDRETWQGDFNSREEAMQAAMNDEHNKGCLVVYTGIAKLYTPALKSETVLDILKIEADEIAGIAAADWLKLGVKNAGGGQGNLHFLMLVLCELFLRSSLGYNK